MHSLLANGELPPGHTCAGIDLVSLYVQAMHKNVNSSNVIAKKLATGFFDAMKQLLETGFYDENPTLYYDQTKASLFFFSNLYKTDKSENYVVKLIKTLPADRKWVNTLPLQTEVLKAWIDLNKV